MGTALKYRPEIDGLRGLAVSLVVLYHAKLYVPGGFIGVDVFFVVSGFLITKIIVGELNEQRFKLVRFWERRVRRIVPALATTLLGTLVCAWFVLLPVEFNALGQSAVAAAGSASNVYFWVTTDYFGIAAGDKPLLHTWSLAVEEQFYLLLPLALVWMQPLGPRWRSAVLGLFAIGSFTYSAIGVTSHPAFTFYMLPTRVWELLLGSLLAVGVLDRVSVGRRAREVLSWVGIGLIATSAGALSHESRFPGWAALPACLGTAMFIWANSAGATMLGWVFSSRPLVGTGLISYSLYLIHWPCLVLVNYWRQSELPLPVAFATVGGSCILAYASWRWVETPVRKGQLLQSRRHLFLCATALLLAVGGAGYAIYRNAGVRGRFDASVLRYSDQASESDALRREAISRGARKAALHMKAEVAQGVLALYGRNASGEPADLLVWGNSHAEVLAPLFEELARHTGATIAMAMLGSVLPLVASADGEAPSGIVQVPGGEEFNGRVMEFIRRERVRECLLVSRWDPLGALAHSQSSEALAKTSAVLLELGCRATFLRQVPYWDSDPVRRLAMARMRGESAEDQGQHVAAFRARDHALGQVWDSLDGTVRVLDPVPWFVDESGFLGLEKRGRTLWIDFNHVSIWGGQEMRPGLEAFIRSEVLR